MATLPWPTNEQKREALELVLRSTLLARSGQLRSFLQYVCEMEMTGKASELSEHLIGVEALGKGPGYSTGEDASVRRLALTLRERLDELYRTELVSAKLRVELPKGSYTPRYVLASEAPEPGSGPPRRFRVPAVVWAIAAFLAGGGCSYLLLSKKPAPSGLDPVLAEAWGPLVQRGGGTVIVLGGPIHYAVVPEASDAVSGDAIPVPQNHAIWSNYQSFYPATLRNPPHLFLEPGDAAIPVGELRATVVAVRLLTEAGTAFRVLPERDLPAYSAQSWNVLLLGNPESSITANSILSRASWTVRTDRQRNAVSIGPVKGAADAVRVYDAVRNGEGAESDSFGLITVVRAEVMSLNESLRTVVISGTDGAACHSAAEFFCSAKNMKEMRERFRHQGLAGFPPAYQIVIKCRVLKGEALSAKYEAHSVLRE